MVLGGSARTLGNMNRPIIAVNATQPPVKVVQAMKTQETNRAPIMNPRRSACAAVPATEAAAEPFDGLGGTDCGLAAGLGAGLAAGGAAVAVAVPDAAAA